MAEQARIIIPIRFDINRCSPNLRQHWRKKAAVTKAARETARHAWALAGYPVSDVPVRVSLEVHRGRKLDQANLWAAAKGLLDGVFVDGMTPDDGEKWVRLGEVHQVTGKEWLGREEVWFVVEPAEVQP